MYSKLQEVNSVLLIDFTNVIPQMLMHEERLGECYSEIVIHNQYSSIESVKINNLVLGALIHGLPDYSSLGMISFITWHHRRTKTRPGTWKKDIELLTLTKI